MEVQDSWKGRIWFLILLWPLYGIPKLLDFNQIEGPNSLWIKCLVIVGWILFALGIFKAIKLIRG